MTPQQMPEQGGGDIFDEMVALLMQLVEMAGPEWVLEALAALMQEAESGGEGMPTEPPMQMPSMQPKPPGNAFAR